MGSNKKFVQFRGVTVVEGWPEKILAAQDERSYLINGTLEQRVPFGEERGWSVEPGEFCHDCGVMSGELHVPSCDVEECPVCREQVIGCDCKIQRR